ncbi:Rha family transcriptional regulator [Neisseria polysaccharea]|uniref:Rha family transcriptional regulator n=1 Tax=Neisseria polysaccharea TaxID=489 RepID=UPI002729F7C2|nr:Rha family transcriptional regulator [Neisseria polysaccharea]
MNAISINFQNFVQIQNSQIVTTSEFVAQAFGKQHKHVLEKIEQISKEIKASFFEPNFRLKAKQVKTGFGFRETKSYELTKDGFMLLVMGFTGKQAMAIKIAYIEAFNAMSEAILDLNNTVSDGIKPAKTTADDRTGLRQAVAALVGRKGIDYSSAYSMIHQRFNVEAIEDIPAEKLPEAVAYVHALTLHTGLTGEVLDREPLPAPQPALPISGNALYDLAVAVRYGAWAIQMGRDVSLPLKQLGCKQAVTMWTVWAETRSRLKAAANALEALNAHADAEHAAKIRPMLPEIRNLSSV